MGCMGSRRSSPPEPKQDREGAGLAKITQADPESLKKLEHELGLDWEDSSSEEDERTRLSPSARPPATVPIQTQATSAPQLHVSEEAPPQSRSSSRRGSNSSTTRKKPEQALRSPRNTVESEEDAALRNKVALKLWSNGFTVRQALLFWREYGTPPHSGLPLDSVGAWTAARPAAGLWRAAINRDTQTKDVVSRIVLPETKKKKCAYMQSSFMEKTGGPRRPGTLVCHWWRNAFYHDLLAIVEDATGRASEACEEITSYVEITDLEKRLPAGTLDRTYWMCVFAVNQHASICGTSEHPCDCGSAHFEIGNPLCETDKVGEVLSMLPDGVAVVLDRELHTMKRIWCLYEIGKARSMNKRVRYYLPGGFDKEVMARPLRLNSVYDCESTFPVDWENIVRLVSATGTIENFDRLISENVLPDLRKWCLQQSAMLGDAEQVLRVLQEGAGVDSVVGNNGTALFVAAQKNRTQVVKVLLNAGADMNAMRPSDGASPVFMAALEGHSAIAELLIKRSASANEARTSDGITPLFIAAHQGHTEVVKSLARCKASLELVRPRDGVSALYSAAERGHAGVVKALAMAGAADINRETETGCTPLYVASEMGRLEVVQALLAARAIIDQATTDGVTPLYMASFSGHPRIVDMLLKSRAHVNQPVTTDGTTPLFVAAQNGHYQVLQLLLNAGATVNQARPEDGLSPLSAGAWDGFIDVVRLLLDRRAAVNQAQTHDGATPLFVASQEGHVQVVKDLMKSEANVNQADNEGCSPLYVSVHGGSFQVAKALLDSRASVNQAVFTDGTTPLFMAAQNGQLQMVKLLLDASADVHHKTTTDKTTAIETAKTYGHAQVIEVLKAQAKTAL